MLILSLCACGKESEDKAAVYEETISGLKDNELFVMIDTNAPLPVLLVTSQVYDDGTGKQASIRPPATLCSVLRFRNLVRSSWQKKFGSNLMKINGVFPLSADTPAAFC